MRYLAYILVVALTLVAVLALAGASAPTERGVAQPSLRDALRSPLPRGAAGERPGSPHPRGPRLVRFQLYKSEHQAATRLGKKVRALRRHVRWLRAQLALARHVQSRRSSSPPLPVAGVDWRARQIAAAEVIARESGGDPWPNCPDPYDGSGASWEQTVACENGGNWLDSPGYYRCGLQFDPMWERRFGRLCP